MSDEGELKKRISAVSDVITMTYDTYPAMYENKPHLSDVNRILDEAKTGFPKLSKKANTADRILHSIECLEWAKKWFGEQK